MGVRKLFSKRQAELIERSDVFRYDVFPEELVNQVSGIFTDIQDYFGVYYTGCVCEQTLRDVCREHGRTWSKRGPHSTNDEFERFVKYFESAKNPIHRLDYIEAFFQDMSAAKGERYRKYTATRKSSFREPSFDEEIAELNHRFREHALGYQLVELHIVRVDSELIHDQVVKPALRFLQAKHFEGAREEFLSAHDHYLHGKYEETMVDCCKAFESAMKAICDRQRFTYDTGRATARDLIAVLNRESFFPPFWQTSMSNLTALLESSIPTARNKVAGHGAGSTPRVVPEEMVSYMLHMTASTILYLAKLDKARKPY